MLHIQQPPWLKTNDGKPRRVGVELEFSGLSLDETSQLVADLWGLNISNDGRYQRVLKGDSAGDWVIELDFALLKQLGHKEYADTLSGDIEQGAETLLAQAAAALVPLEIVGPPLPLSRLKDVEQLIVKLRTAGAKGTEDKWRYAFGMQFNPELPSLQPECIMSIFKAFLCLYDWLLARTKVNITRQLTSYIDPFTAGYVKQVLDPGYWPELPSLIDDYLKDNASRNRALDLLPLFLHLDKARVRAVTTEPLIKARPTFHYRLPNCLIDQADWSLALAWNDWVQVERLAFDKDKLNACCKARLAYLQQPLQRLFGDWVTEVEQQWLNDPL